MKKIIAKKINKIWGYEIWLYSPVKNLETKDENGEITKKGPLVKIIKANKKLSVQVHPDDKWANKLENQKNGKNEAWYILDCQENAEIIIGLKNFDPIEIKRKLKENTFEENLKKIKVQKNNFYNIPAGLVHGIGAGITILEVQQPSDVTYRYYDYNRLENNKPRELHIDKAIKVQKNLSYKLKPISLKPLCYKNIVGTQTFYFNQINPIHIKEEALVVNLDTYDTFIFDKNEQIKMSNFVIISL